jgi:hypothetical protein
MHKLLCPYYLDGCSKRFRSQGGRTYHVRSFHSNNNIIPNQNDNRPDDEVLHVNNHEPLVERDEEDFSMDAELDDVPPASPASPTQPEAAKARVHRPAPQRNFHPHINGIFFKLALYIYIYI